MALLRAGSLAGASVGVAGTVGAMAAGETIFLVTMTILSGWK